MRRSKVLTRLVVVLGTSAVLAAVVVIAACGRNSEPTGVAGLTSEPYFIRGNITSANPPWGFLVEGQPGTSYQVTTARFTVGENTVYRRADGSAATADDLRVGTAIRLWITGAIMESHPVQVRAEIVVID